MPIRRDGAPAHRASTAAGGAGATRAAEVNLADTLVVLDTCVLMPPRLSDVLMELRARQLFSLHWSDDIETEYVRNMQSVLGFPKTSVLRRLARDAALLSRVARVVLGHRSGSRAGRGGQ
jgi:hypothetical protein